MNAQDCQVDILQLQFLQKGMNSNEFIPFSILRKWTSMKPFPRRHCECAKTHELYNPHLNVLASYFSRWVLVDRFTKSDPNTPSWTFFSIRSTQAQHKSEECYEGKKCNLVSNLVLPHKGSQGTRPFFREMVCVMQARFIDCSSPLEFKPNTRQQPCIHIPIRLTKHYRS